ncbi:MAG: M28 family peptidase [Dehalococcoidia bacterium]|nr:M28 family peptidase [Dehalococcoidia bacterium]
MPPSPPPTAPASEAPATTPEALTAPAPARTTRRRAARLASVLAALALLAACGDTRAAVDDGAAGAPPASASPTAIASRQSTPAAVDDGAAGAPPASASPTAIASRQSTPAAPATPEAARAFAHIRQLAGDIGVRAATTDGERRAAEYIRAQLEAAGYRATLEPFEVNVTLRGTATMTLADGSGVLALPLSGSANASVSGPIVPVGLGRTQDYDVAPRPARGAVVLAARGETTFADKARAAQAAGAVALVIANNETGIFNGNLGDERVTIPVLAVERESLAIARRAGSATITVETEQTRGTSYNVVGAPSAAPCTAYMGAHYDSVPAGPGANDNASGTALLLELARVRRTGGLCVIAFGAEEVGLLGSRAYARAHPVAAARFMLNFDMVAKLTRPFFIGDPALTALGAEAATKRGLSIRAGNFGPDTSSDHATFAAAGVPVLMFYSGDDEFIHTARDTVENTSAEQLGSYLALAANVLDTLLAR